MESRIVRTGAPIKRKLRARTAGADQAGFVARLQLVVQQWPSADRLAKATGVSPSAFRKWLKGVAEPSRDRLVALAAHARSSQLPEGAANLNIAQFLLLPKRLEAAAAGAGHPHASGPTGFIGFRHDWIRATFGREPDEVNLE